MIFAVFLRATSNNSHYKGGTFSIGREVEHG